MCVKPGVGGGEETGGGGGGGGRRGGGRWMNETRIGNLV